MLRVSKGLFVFMMFLVTIGLSYPGSSYAQTGTTSLRGTLTDKSGSTISGATVTLVNVAQALTRTTESKASGDYEFLSLPPGTYQMFVEKDGFRKYEQKDLQLLVNNPATSNITLEIGSVTQTIEVSAQTANINTTDASLGNAFGENQVKELPLEGRNVPDLLSLQPGVAYTGNRPDMPASDSRNGAVNGARSDQSNVTLDGIPVNDESGHAFTSVLPVTLDSVEEFRVTTSNYNADQGSSSGAQVALVTKSGTNEFHGSAYEYHRNTYTSANDYFIKQSELQNCALANPEDCNKPPKLIRNIFGGSLGGPVKKDRLYFFLNYEGTRRAEQVSQTVQVPSASLRDGVIQYACAAVTDSSGNVVQTAQQVCPGGAANAAKGLSGATYTPAAGFAVLGTTQLKQIDPLHIGPSSVASTYLNTYPTPNVPGFGDGLNYQGFNFAAPISDTQNVYIAKLDYNITPDGRHHVSVSGALRNDNNAGAPFLPGQAPSDSVVNYSKGLIVNYNGVLRQSLINNFRYGFIRESIGNIGNSNQSWILFRGLNDQVGAVTRSNSFQRPVHTFADDLSWIRGKHTWQFGAQFAFIREPRDSFRSSFSDGVANAGWFNTTGFADKNSPLNPANNINPATGQPYAGVDPGFANSYDFPLTALLGLVSQVDAQYNFARNGNALPQGAALSRHFALNSYEPYVQDVWKATRSLTVTLGLRYSLFSPLWETKGLQVCPTFNLGQWFTNRGNEGANGIPSNQDQPVAFNWCGPANGKSGYWNWDYKNLGPRVAFAWAPSFNNGLLGSVFGSGKTSIRGGFGIVYDRFGQGIADNFDRAGSFGLSTQLTNRGGFQTVSSAPRLTDIHAIPTTDNNGNTVFLPSPGANFPVPFPAGNFTAATGLDSSLKTPYAYAIDFSVARELKSGFSLEVSYVGRLSHRILTSEDLAMPLDLKDKKSGLDYFTAAQALAKLYRAGVRDENFSNSMLPANVVQYWQDVISALKPGGAYAIGAAAYPGNGRSVALTGGCVLPNDSTPPTSTLNPVLAAFDGFCGGNFNETTPLQNLDSIGIQDIGNATLTCQNNPSDPSCTYYFPSTGPFTFFTPQYAALYAWRSLGTANYNAMQVVLKHRLSHGVQFDFNYTYSKSIDLSSDAERQGVFGGIGGNQIINSWSPFQFRAPSDFDTTHQFNSNWIVDLPFGRNRAIGRGMGKGLDALVGGWQLSGLYRWTSGFPISVFNGFNFPTNWDISGNAVPITPPNQIQTGAFKNPADGSVNIFKAGGSAAAAFFREPLPGEAGFRNFIRGDGFFGVDLGLSKRWVMPWTEKQSLQLRWEVFNVTNSVRFDAQSTNNAIDTFGPQLGNYTRLLTQPRVMQFALRYEF